MNFQSKDDKVHEEIYEVDGKMLHLVMAPEEIIAVQINPPLDVDVLDAKYPFNYMFSILSETPEGSLLTLPCDLPTSLTEWREYKSHPTLINDWLNSHLTSYNPSQIQLITIKLTGSTTDHPQDEL